MLIPLLLAIFSATLYASSGHIDKYLISKAVKNADYRALILVSTFISGGIMTIIYLFICNFNLTLDLPSILILFLGSILEVTALIFWFKALDKEDVTIVTIMLQLMPVFILFIAPIFLKDQNITKLQLIGGLIVMLAAITVTYEPSKRRFSKNKLIALIMMTFASFSYAMRDILERYVNQNHDFNQTILWLNIALLIVGIFLIIFIKSYRESFRKMLKSNGAKIIGLNLVNELFYSFGRISSAFAGTMTSVALISFVTQGVQPFAVMLLGILITKLFPKVEKEGISKKEIIKRTITIIICAIGLACIEFG